MLRRSEVHYRSAGKSKWNSWFEGEEPPPMSQRKKETPIEPKLTLAEARARIAEFKALKRIEGKGGGAAVRSGHDDKPPNQEAQR